MYRYSGGLSLLLLDLHPHCIIPARYVHQVLRLFHPQSEARTLTEYATKSANTGQPLVTPEVVIPTYIKFVNTTQGFGLFAGADVPTQLPYESQNSFPSEFSTGTYGGVVCAKREALHRKALFRIGNEGVLDSLDENETR